MIAMLERVINESSPSLIHSNLDGYFVINRARGLIHSGGPISQSLAGLPELLRKIPQIEYYLENADQPGAFYEFPALESGSTGTVYIGPLPGSQELLIACFNGDLTTPRISRLHSGVYFLSIIAQTIKAFHEADRLEDILRIVLTGVTAGVGLGFNRAFILLTETVDKRTFLVGKYAIGPASPEEAGYIWGKLSSGEITLEMMFDEILHGSRNDHSPISRLIEGLVITLDGQDNLFAQAARERRSILVSEATLGEPEYEDFRQRLGPGPMALVPMVGKESFQGVIIADNYITRKPIAQTDLQLLDIFARYASDSIEKFRLYENLELKIRDLERANRTIILNRENLIKAERLKVLAEMAGQVAHEIRNPLTVIGGFAKMMVRRMSAEHENYENLNIILEQVARIEAALGRFTSLMNYQTKNDQQCELGDLIESSTHLRSTEAGSYRFELIRDEPIMIMVDADLFRQAMFLILQEAGNLSEHDGTISIKLGRSGTKALIRIEFERNTGANAEKLYRRFFSSQSNEIAKGLIVALEIIRFYKGDVGLEVDNTAVPSFYIEIPCL